MAAYDKSNIFAKILRGEIPCHRVLEDDDVLVFMDAMPQADGHSLVVPKTPSRNILDADPATLGSVIATTKRVAAAAMRAFAADGVTVMQFNEPAAGQTVFHLHFHIVPRKEGEPMRSHARQMEKPEVLAANAEKLRKALAED